MQGKREKQLLAHSNSDIMLDRHFEGPQPRHGDCSLERLPGSLFSGALDYSKALPSLAIFEVVGIGE